MKRLALVLMAVVLLLAAPALAATPVPMSTAEIPVIPAAPAAPRVVRAVQSGATASITFDRDLPREMLLNFVALDGQGRETAVRYGQEGRAYTTQELPVDGKNQLYIDSNRIIINGTHHQIA